MWPFKKKPTPEKSYISVTSSGYYYTNDPSLQAEVDKKNDRHIAMLSECEDARKKSICDQLEAEAYAAERGRLRAQAEHANRTGGSV